MSKFDCGKFFILSAETNPLQGSSGKDLIISSHGGWATGDGTFRPTATRFEVQFYTFEHVSAIGEVIDAINGTVDPIDAASGAPIKDYQLSYFEHDPSHGAILGALGKKPVHVLTVKPGRDTSLKEVLTLLHNSHFQYKRVRCLFCRYTGKDKEAEARLANPGERDRLNKLGMMHSVVRELNKRNGFYA
jgi:hypothetical protein